MDFWVLLSTVLERARLIKRSSQSVRAVTDADLGSPSIMPRSPTTEPSGRTAIIRSPPWGDLKLTLSTPFSSR